MAAVARLRVEQIRLAHLPGLVRDGRLRIPSFQRSFRWDRDDVVRLFDSVMRGYPIGTLLMWQRPAAAARLGIGPLKIDAPEAADAYWVVDGQQRVTSLVGALAAPPDLVDPRFRIFYDPDADRFVSAGRREHVREHWLPVQAAFDTEMFRAWRRSRPWLSDADSDRYDDVMRALRAGVPPGSGGVRPASGGLRRHRQHRRAPEELVPAVSPRTEPQALPGLRLRLGHLL